MKALGKDIYAFFESDAWPENYIYEDEDAKLRMWSEDGERLLDLLKEYDFTDLGYLVNRLTYAVDELPLASVFEKWKNPDVVLVVNVPKDKEQEFRKLVYFFGATISQ
jgi:hypothetical protein